MIYVTGDTHGETDLSKIAPGHWDEGYRLGRDDYLIICGDFGGIWRPGARDDQILAWWESRPWTTLFVDGNHENHDVIDSYAVTERFGSQVQVVPGFPHVVHLMRGCVYDLPYMAGRSVRCLVMGGACSIDRGYRVRGVSWWDREMPSEEEYDRCTASLDGAGWEVDYVFTHELPADLRMAALDWRSYLSLFSGSDRLSNYLQWVWEGLDRERLGMWYAGHYHVDRMVDDKCRVLYQNVAPLGARKTGKVWA